MWFEHGFTFDLRGLYNFLGLGHVVLSLFVLNLFAKSYQVEKNSSKKKFYNTLSSPIAFFRIPRNSASLRKARLFGILYMLPMTILLVYMGYFMGL